MNKFTRKKNKQKHDFHLVEPSPWPILTAFSILMLTLGAVMYFHSYVGGYFLLPTGFILLLLMLTFWWRDVVREATFEGRHTLRVQQGIKIGMILFLLSEVMFFFAFFWAFFHFSFNPGSTVGGIWPPATIYILNSWKIPLANTILLLCSGASVTWAHFAVVQGSKYQASVSLIITISLAIVFTSLQIFEYATSPFSLADGAYASAFYMVTGLHGFHVFIGTCFLAVCLLRLHLNHFTREHHLGLEAAAWYWHFVDVVWLYLFLAVYWWGK
jgi:heme/copper-type cytochrome/quinol oxidase subunit 3